MTGLQTLLRDGFDLAAAATQPADISPPMAELLEWHATADALPDADITVLMWVREAGGADWHSGWWDGQDWRDAASGGVVAGEVSHWAEPEGPGA